MISRLAGRVSVDQSMRRMGAAVIFIVALASGTAFGQVAMDQRAAADPLTVLPHDRVPSSIDNGATVALAGQVQPGARPANDLGPVSGSLAMPRMILSLQRSADQQAALDAFSEAVQNSRSPYFHKWLTPESFGLHFGLSETDLNRVTQWLESFGFTIDDIPAGHWTITFSGTAAQVAEAFHTSIHNYRIGGEVRYANSSAPQIPQALSGIISGIAGLHNFRPKHAGSVAAPEYGSGVNGHSLDPSDFATIYDLNTLYGKEISGLGVKIAVIEPCTMDVSLAKTFWSFEGLAQASNLYQSYGAAQTCAQADPTGAFGYSGETYLDYEWAGAVAPQAQVYLVSSNASDAVLGGVQGVVTNNLAPVVSISYSQCEATQDPAWAGLWQQAHTQGITGLVASGDEGAAGCDGGSETTATQGLAINGICASPYVVCVGGTDFNDTSNNSAYWSSAGKALGYIPEVAWNESTGSATIFGASGGGYSTTQTKPSWQTGNTNTQRGVPDVALTAAAHDGYRVCTSASACSSTSTAVGNGTSVAAPAFAGIMALIVQATGQPQGSPDQTLYSLAGQTGIAAFHDVTSGNNSVAGQTGYSAGPGWDPVTGLGSVDAAVLAANWPGAVSGFPAVTSLEVSKSAPSGCTAPPAATSFLTTDNTVNLFFDATVATSDVLSNDWLAPNGTVVPGVTFGTASGTFCFPGSTLSIGSLPAAELGQWQARIYDNSKQFDAVSFTVNTPLAIQTSATLLTGFIGGAYSQDLTATGGSPPYTWTLTSGTLPAGLTFTAGALALGNATITGTPTAAATSTITFKVTDSASNSVSQAFTLTVINSNATALARVGVLSQFAPGAFWDTTIYVVNNTAAAVPVRLVLRGDNGSTTLAVPTPLTITQQGDVQTGVTATTLDRVLAPNTTLVVDAGLGQSNLAQGWVDVLSTAAVNGFAVFRYSPNGLTPTASGYFTPYEGTVPLQTQLAVGTITLPFDNTSPSYAPAGAQFTTGIAIGSLTGGTVTATFYNSNGTQLGSPQTFSLGALAHTAFMVNAGPTGQNWSFTNGYQGVVTFTGPSLIGLGLRASPYGTLTTVPAILQ